MLLPLPTPTEMAMWDSETINSIGIQGVTLMESASREAVAVLLDEYGPVSGTEVFCFAGSGNNGGDAFAMARQLIDLDADVTIFHTKPVTHYKGDALTNLHLAQKLGITLQYLSDIDISTLPKPDIVIDGLLGTGFVGTLSPNYLSLVQAINRMGESAFVLAIDIPSGLNGLTGKPQPVAVIADSTVTFQAAKLGLAMPGASNHTGMLHVRPIGIPTLILEQNPVKHHLITRDVMDRIPQPDPEMHKGSAGHVLIIGGSIGLTGAPHLAALGALRSGAGLVTIACPGALADAAKAVSPDIMTLPLGHGESWEPSMANNLLPELDRFDAVVLGPGLGRAGKTVDFIRSFIAECPARMVLDADALYGLSLFPNLLTELTSNTVLTPHPGEMARLIGVSTPEIQANRLETAESFVEKTAATLVLKGAGTLVINTELTCINPFAEPNLSVGGSGDVLSGLIASMLAQGLLPLEAACLGVFWHGMAGRLLRENFPARGNLASEIANMLPVATQMIDKEFSPC